MANFDLYAPLVLRLEGGFQDDPQDTGNYNSLNQLVGTNFGIAAFTYEAYINKPPSRSEMINLPKETALVIHKTRFWDKMNGDSFKNQDVAETVIDHGINAGASRSGRILQNVLNDHFGFNLSVDGAVGNQTISAANSVSQSSLFEKFNEGRVAYYKSLNRPHFINGWLNRVKNFSSREVAEATSKGLLLFLSVIIIGGVAYLIKNASQ